MKKLYLLSLYFLLWSCTSTPKGEIVIIEPKVQNHQEGVRTGLDVLLEDYPLLLKGKSIALITNHTGISKNNEKNYELFSKNSDIDLKKIFAPEHGFYGEASAGEKVEYNSNRTGVEIISLYGKNKKPTPDMLEGIDLIIYDIQDVGARFYTYISTLGMAMEAAGEHGIEVMVLDRPNPIGGNIIEGAILDTAFKSFVGYYPIPTRYGLTVGELSQMAYNENWLTSRPPTLTIVKMDKWERSMYFDETGLTWVSPSPNIPDLETAIIYPGMCIYEATNVSEGRGTKKPFKQIGAPWMSYSIAKELNNYNLEGVEFGYAKFKPKNLIGVAENPKFENIKCIGFKINITDKKEYRPIKTAIHSTLISFAFYPDQFKYESKKLGRLWGNKELFLFLTGKLKEKKLFKSLKSDLDIFVLQSAPYFLY